MSAEGLGAAETQEGMLTGAEEALERNKQIIRTFLESMNTDNLDAAFSLLTDDCAWFSLSTRKESSAATMKQAVQYVTKNVMRAPIQIEPLIFTAEADRVALLARGSAVTRDGVEYRQMYHFLFQLVEGRVCKIWELMDTAHVAQVFGTGASSQILKSAAKDQTPL